MILDGRPKSQLSSYYFKWNGEDRMYKVPVKNEEGDIHYLVQRFAECNEGDELILEYKRKGVKGYIEVLPVNGVSSIEVGDEEENDGVPDIDLDDDEKESGDSKGKGDDEAEFRFRIRSKSQKGKYHIVAWCGGDECECTCTAGQFHHPCRHVRIAKHHLKGLRAEKH